MRVCLKISLVIGLAVLTGCGPDQPPPSQPDVTTQPWYKQAVQQLASTAGDAEKSFTAGKADDAAALIEKGEPLESQVLSVPRPTLAAMAAATDLDDLYGRMLLSNKHYAWALFLFQKCSARWKYWQPQTEDTARRLARAEAEIAECQRGMAGGGSSTKAKKSAKAHK